MDLSGRDPAAARPSVGRRPTAGGQRTRRSPSPDVDRCGVCDVRTRSKVAKWMHVRREHGDDRSLMCSLCVRRFSNVHAAYLHERVHHERSAARGRGRHAYTCELCARYCSGRKSLAVHVAEAHPAARAALCGVCAVYMGDVPSLVAHLHADHGRAMVHGPAARLRCDLCGKRCRGRKHARSHRRVHGVRDVVHREHMLSDISSVVLW